MSRIGRIRFSSETYEAEGNYIATRMIGNFVYVVSQKGAWVYEGVLDLPSYRENGSICQVPVTSIYYYNGTDPYYAYTTIASINTQERGVPDTVRDVPARVEQC